jgi:glycosyltransferase involved in cell wall biosynthesis
MKLPDVSVVVTTRNRRAFLGEAVDSVLAQQGPSWELIIVDDASDDGTPAYLGALEADSRIRVIRNSTRRERSLSRNSGLAAATGGAVMFLDDDDVLLPGALENLHRALASSPTAVASCGGRVDWRPSLSPNARRRDSHVWVRTVRSILPELVFGWSAVSGQNLYRMDAARRTPGFKVDVTPAEDRLFWMEIARQGPVALIPEAVMLYRLHDQQWRPTDMTRIRNRVFHLGQLMERGEARRSLIRTRYAAMNIERAEQSLKQARLVGAAIQSLSALVVCPKKTLFSPLIFPWVFRRLARNLNHGLRDWWSSRMAGASRSMDIAG